MSLSHTLLWEFSRVGGMVAYLLATASVCLGLLLSLKVRSRSWPRFVTDGLHRHVTLVSLIFIGLHSLTVWLDPFTAFTPAEVLVPFTTHYRPLWIGLGIVASYLMIAVWASEWVRPHIGYAWWRRFHYTSFAVFVLGTLHGIGAGSDTRTWWGIAIYAGAMGATVGLLAWRIWVAVTAERRAAILLTLGAATLALAVWALVLPLQAGWNAIANNGNGNGQVLATATRLDVPFVDQFNASLNSAGDGVDGALSGAYPGLLHIGLDSAVVQLRLNGAPSCSGTVTAGDGRRLVGTCTTSDGQRLSLIIVVSQATDATIQGQLQASAVSNGQLRQSSVDLGADRDGDRDAENIVQRT
jgi:Predicted ferric reductase